MHTAIAVSLTAGEPFSASAVSSALCGHGILRVSLPMTCEEKPSENIAVSLGDDRNLRGRQGAGNMGNEGGMLAREADTPAEHAGAAAGVDVAGGPHIDERRHGGGVHAESTQSRASRQRSKEDAEVPKVFEHIPVEEDARRAGSC